jgi:hypothetical protein
VCWEMSPQTGSPKMMDILANGERSPLHPVPPQEEVPIHGRPGRSVLGQVRLPEYIHLARHKEIFERRIIRGLPVGLRGPNAPSLDFGHIKLPHLLPTLASDNQPSVDNRCFLSGEDSGLALALQVNMNDLDTALPTRFDEAGLELYHLKTQ